VCRWIMVPMAPSSTRMRDCKAAVRASVASGRTASDSGKAEFLVCWATGYLSSQADFACRDLRLHECKPCGMQYLSYALLRQRADRSKRRDLK
jgi:hypothetical protein